MSEEEKHEYYVSDTAALLSERIESGMVCSMHLGGFVLLLFRDIPVSRHSLLLSTHRSRLKAATVALEEALP